MIKYSGMTGVPVEPRWVSYLARQVKKRGIGALTLLFTLYAVVSSAIVGEIAFFLSGQDIGLGFRLLPIIIPALVAPWTFYLLFRVVGSLENTKSTLSATLEKLEHKYREAEHANAAKSDFLANMSHELRTPLNAIIGFSDALNAGFRGSLSKPQSEYVTDIRQSGEHLLDLINDILDLSKIEAGKLELSETDIDIEEQIAKSLPFVKEQATVTGVAVKLAPANEAISVRADERMFRQILVNLLSNAVKFTPKGGTVTISSIRSSDGGLSIQVTDTGLGMPTEDIPKALEPFEQTTSGKGTGGVGLGLPLANGLAMLHGGSLSIESAPGRGTTAAVNFPAERIN